MKDKNFKKKISKNTKPPQIKIIKNLLIRKINIMKNITKAVLKLIINYWLKSKILKMFMILQTLVIRTNKIIINNTKVI